MDSALVTSRANCWKKQLLPLSLSTALFEKIFELFYQELVVRSTHLMTPHHTCTHLRRAVTHFQSLQPSIKWRPLHVFAKYAIVAASIF